MEAAIEDELDRVLDPSAKGPRRLEGHGVGGLSAEPDLGQAYVDHLVSLLEGRRLDGLRLVVDSANGSASALAGGLFERLGAEVVSIGCEPDGTNINDGCGSTSTGTLAGAVVEHRADLGLALDGDADRLLAVGPDGALVNGDELIALFALDLAERGLLAGNTVVVTVMTNLGFRHGHGGAGHHREGDRGGGPLRAGRPGQGRTVPRRGAVRPHHLPAPGHHRRRAADRADPGRPGGPVGHGP